MTENQLPAPVAWRMLPDDLRTHLGDFLRACMIAKRAAETECPATVDSDDPGYWQHQIDTIKVVQAALPHPAALSGGDSEPAATHRTAGETIGGGDGESDFIAEAISEAYGERCPDFDAGCFACRAWKQYDDLAALAPPPVEPVQGVTEAAIRAELKRLQSIGDLVVYEMADDNGLDIDEYVELIAGVIAALATAPEGTGGDAS